MNRPLTPPSCDLRAYPAMLLEVGPLRDSDFALIASGDEFRAGVMLWAASWHQLPAASLPDDDRMLAGLARVDVRKWLQLRAVALRGWIKCDDGRLYHRKIAEKALECWIDNLFARISSGAGHSKRYGGDFDRAPLDAEIVVAADHLEAINPKSAKLLKCKRPKQGAPGNLQLDSATGSATGTPLGWQKNRTEQNIPPEGGQAPFGEPSKEAWTRAVRLLTQAGRMTDQKARAFFGGVLRDAKIDAAALLPSIVRAEGTGTQDPQAYLKVAAANLSRRKGEPNKPTVADWTEAEWTTAVRLYRDDGGWSDDMGPKPDQPGCQAPTAVLASFGYVPGVEPIRKPATA